MPPRKRDELSPESATPDTADEPAAAGGSEGNVTMSQAQPQAQPQPQASAQTTARPTARVKPVVSRQDQFLIGAGPLAFLEPPDLEAVARRLRERDDVEVVEVLAPRKGANGDREAARGKTPAAMRSVIVARMPTEQADALRQQFGGRLTIENDALLTVCSSDPAYAADAEFHDPGVAVPHATGVTVTLTVTGDGKPLADSTVYVFGAIWSAQGLTDGAGRVRLTVYGESADTLNALLVRPRTDHWSYWLRNPILRTDQDNAVELKSLGRSHPGFPKQPLTGWGQQAMGLDRLPADWKGRGVKVALVDSGAATGHRNLAGIRAGIDVVGRTADGWTHDAIGHGSHCAGIVAGLDTGTGIRGFAPEAEVHVCRVFPGGRLSDLIRSLDYCLEAEIDVVDLGLGCAQASQIVEQRLALARQAGMACIAAAGNTTGPVEYPAASPQVLAVAAIGRRGEFPDDSYHATLALDGAENAMGDLFPARFSSHGPAVDVVGPGVAIISSVPPDNFAAWDGTSMAAAHVAGLAVLLLAHHPDFRSPALGRDSRRVDHLFQILKDSAQPLSLAESGRSGAGLPDAVRAFRLEPGIPGYDAAPAERPAWGISTGNIGTGDIGWPAQPNGNGVDLDGLREAMIQIDLLNVEPAGGSPRRDTASGRRGGSNGGSTAATITLEQIQAAMKEARLL